VLTLIEQAGGLSFFIPMHIEPDNNLARWLSRDDYRALCWHYGGDHLEIPRCHRAKRLRVWLAIAQDKRGGESNAQLAQKYGLTERAIRGILSKVQ